METILFLAHTEADGSLAKPALEALAAAQVASAAAGDARRRAGRRGRRSPPPTRSPPAAPRAFLGVVGRRLRPAALRHRRRRRRSARAAPPAPPSSSRPPPRAGRAPCPASPTALGGRVDTHVTGISARTARRRSRRWYYRQRMEGVLQRTQRPWVILLDPGCQPGLDGRRAGTATVEAVRRRRCPTRRAPTVCRRPGAREPTRRPSGPTPSCCSSPAPAGPRSRPTARRTSRRPNS